jgi:nitrate/nitrite transporter NarK
VPGTVPDTRLEKVSGTQTSFAVSYRWAVLGAGTFAQATYSAIWSGIAVMAPALRTRYDLTLGQVGVLISAALAGSVLSLIPWGLLTDRVGERLALLAGVGSCGGALLLGSLTHRFWTLLPCLLLAGFAGASVQSASGRAVMYWFGPAERGLALGIRQTAIPIAGFASALALPPIVRAGGVDWGVRTLGIACLVSAAVGWLFVRDARHQEEDVHVAPHPLRDRRIWWLSVGSALVLAPQMCVVGFTVLFLHEQRGLSTAEAGYVLAAMQLLGIAARIGAGHFSDRRGSRLAPLRAIALALGFATLLSGFVLWEPLAVLIPALIVTGVLSMSWNGLSFASAAERAGRARSGAAIGLQQSLLNASGAVYPGAFGALVAVTSWRLGFIAVALLPLGGWRMLRALR